MSQIWNIYCKHCRYISFSVLFQTKSSLVWKTYTQKIRRIFQTNSTLVWKQKNCFQDTYSKPNLDWFGTIWWPLPRSWKFQTSLCFASPLSLSILHPQVGLSYLLYKQASPLPGKCIWEEFKISLFCFLRKFHTSQMVPHGYDHNSLWPAGIVPLIPILIIKDPGDHDPSSSDWCLLVHLNNL